MDLSELKSICEEFEGTCVIFLKIITTNWMFLGEFQVVIKISGAYEDDLDQNFDKKSWCYNIFGILTAI